jgi:hypothetical protein
VFNNKHPPSYSRRRLLVRTCIYSSAKGKLYRYRYYYKIQTAAVHCTAAVRLYEYDCTSTAVQLIVDRIGQLEIPPL